jgi:hypothetical protein
MKSTASMDNVVLYSQDTEQVAARLGPGISRALATDLTRPYVVKVKMANALPMAVTLYARNRSEAVKFASNRWPNSTCVVEGKS